ncbi:MAG TPA: HigA family addiction module antitoxin [Myxococcales bacterium]|jgi:addiction module HigA family antidote|nr:HigA family addiction module antitoxin [Myxococcales bacterium]
MLPKNRAPTHPGEILLEEFLLPKRMTQASLAAKLGLPIQRINTIVNKKRGITPETALLFAKIFETTPEFWMHLQMKHDLWMAARRMTGS